MNHPPKGSCVQRGCEEPECQKRWRKYKSYQKHTYRSGKRLSFTRRPVSLRVIAEKNRGYTREQIANYYGVNLSTVIRLLTLEGPKRIAIDNAYAILSKPPMDTLPLGQVFAVGTTRRLRALSADGHSAPDVVELIKQQGVEVSREWVGQVVRAKQLTVSGERALAVRRAFSKAQLTPGTNKKVATWARKRGWKRPFQLDEESLDDPLYLEGDENVCSGEVPSVED